MFIPSSYTLAVILCVITMLCWGSWANTQKLASRKLAFPIFYWDYTIGIVLCSLLVGVTLGSFGSGGRSFFTDLNQGDTNSWLSALTGGVIFNLANLLIVAAIDIAGMAVAFPVGIGIALVLGVVVNYLAVPVGEPFYLFLGVGLVSAAIVLDALAYKKLANKQQSTPTMGIVLSVVGGILMGFFFRYVAAAVSTDYANPEAGLFTPYSAVFVFSLGVFFSNFIWNTYFMYRPFKGKPVSYADYFRERDLTVHAVGILGGIIWCLGMSFSMIASEQAGFAISYGLGQGATLVAAAWGVFVWKEFSGAPKGTNRLLMWMFFLFISGLALIVLSRIIS